MRAELKNYRQSPRKVRLIADLIRGKEVARALMILSFLSKRGALPLKKLLQSAIANARQSGKNPDSLFVKKVTVDDGFTFKRLEYRARGSSNIIKKRTSHIMLTLGEHMRTESPQSKAEPTKQ